MTSIPAEDALGPATSELLETAGFSPLPTEAFEAEARSAVRRSALPALIAADVTGVVAAMVLGRLCDGLVRTGAPISNAFTGLIYIPVYLVVMGAYGLYRRGRRRLVASSFPDVSHLVHSLIVSSLIVLGIAAPLHHHLGWPGANRVEVAATGILALAAVPMTRAVARFVVRRRVGSTSRILIVGSGIVASSVVKRLAKVDGVEVIGCVDDEMDNASLPTTGDSVPLLGDLALIPSLVADHKVDHVVVAFSPATGAQLAGLLRSLAADVQISIVPRLFDLLTVRSHVDDLHGLPVVDVAPASLGPLDRFAKRALDVVASSIGLLVISPVLLVVAIAVKLTSPGPILFSQERTGRGGEHFRIHKFRTMRDGADREKAMLRAANEVDGPLFKMKEDPRITKLGGFLRRTSLDELPQLFNVLAGDMSLVGPRPFVTSESAEIAGWAARRFDVRPGMTGLWQVSGRSDLPFDELCRLDYSYVASWSLWWDIRIMWHTPAMILRSRGAY